MRNIIVLPVRLETVLTCMNPYIYRWPLSMPGCSKEEHYLRPNTARCTWQTYLRMSLNASSAYEHLVEHVHSALCMRATDLLEPIHLPSLPESVSPHLTS